MATFSFTLFTAVAFVALRRRSNGWHQTVVMSFIVSLLMVSGCGNESSEYREAPLTSESVELSLSALSDSNAKTHDVRKQGPNLLDLSGEWVGWGFQNYYGNGPESLSLIHI